MTEYVNIVLRMRLSVYVCVCLSVSVCRSSSSSKTAGPRGGLTPKRVGRQPGDLL